MSRFHDRAVHADWGDSLNDLSIRLTFSRSQIDAKCGIVMTNDHWRRMMNWWRGIEDIVKQDLWRMIDNFLTELEEEPEDETATTETETATATTETILTVSVIKPDGVSVPRNIHNTATINGFLYKVAVLCNAARYHHQIRVVFGTVNLHENRTSTVSEVGLTDGSTVSVVGNISGGGLVRQTTKSSKQNVKQSMIAICNSPPATTTEATKNAYDTIAKLASAATPLQAMETLLREQTTSGLDETWDELTKPEPYLD